MPNLTPKSNTRFYALDVFRGATVALMILVNTPGTWSWVYPPLRHAEWHGITPTDLVFPFFLFAVGNAMAFVMPKMEKEGAHYFWSKVLKRAAIILLIGLLLNYFPFVKWNKESLVFKNPLDIRVYGVLQRIALCYLCASVIAFYCKPKWSLIIAFALLLLYWGLCHWCNPVDPYSLSGWFGTEIDKAIFPDKNLYKDETFYLLNTTNTNKLPKTASDLGIDFSKATFVDKEKTKIVFDPEGLASTIGAIAQVLFGFIMGNFIVKNGNTQKTVLSLLIVGAVFWLVGDVWSYLHPINKKIWTGSYVLVTTGMAACLIALLIYLFELIKAPQILGKFFDAFGKNPLFIFVLSGALPRLLGLIRLNNGIDEKGQPKYLSPFGWFYENVCKPIDDKMLGSFIYAIAMILMYWLIAYILDKRKIYIKV